MKHWIQLIVALVVGLASGITAERLMVPEYGIPSSSYTAPQAQAIAARWAANIGGTWAPIDSTHSMRPWISERSVVVMEKVTAADLREGDIVTFQRGKDLVIHQVRKIRSDGSVITEGVNIGFPDDVVQPEQLRRRLVAVLYHR